MSKVPLSDFPRQKLCEIITTYGRSLCDEPLRCKSLLLDYCSEYRREVNILLNALQERVDLDLLVSQDSVPYVMKLNRLVKRLHEEYGVTEEFALWSVESWALALGVLPSTAQPINVSTNSPIIGKNSSASTPAISPRQQQILTVSQTQGVAQYTSIRDALGDAAPYALIQVQPGVYHERLVIEKPVEIVGDAAVSIETLAPCIEMHAPKATLRNLTLRGKTVTGGFLSKERAAIDIPQGKLLLAECDITSESLVCLSIHGPTAQVELHGCRIHDSGGKGIVFSEKARGVVDNCSIYANASVGIEIQGNSNPVIQQCQIYDGGKSGIAVTNNGMGKLRECSIHSHAFANIEIREGGNLSVARCHIQNSQHAGILVDVGGNGLIEACDISGNRGSGIELRRGNTLTVRDCSIHHGQSYGIFFGPNTSGEVEQCTIAHNARSGIMMQQSLNPYIRGCLINENASFAIQLQEASKATVEDCDLRNNRVRAWRIEPNCQVERVGNRE